MSLHKTDDDDLLEVCRSGGSCVFVLLATHTTRALQARRAMHAEGYPQSGILFGCDGVRFALAGSGDCVAWSEVYSFMHGDEMDYFYEAGAEALLKKWKVGVTVVTLGLVCGLTN